MVRRAGGVWVQSVPSLADHLGRALADRHASRRRRACRAPRPHADAELARLVRDIQTQRPDAILVGPLNTRLHAAVWGPP